MEMNEKRLSNVMNKMKEKKLSQIIVTSPASIYYLTGRWINTGERMIALYINIDGRNKLFINKLFPIQDDLGLDLVWFTDSDDPIELLSRQVEKNTILGIDKYWPSHFLIRLMDKNILKGFVNSSDIIDELRMCKDDEEKELMRKSSKINDTVMKKFYTLIKEGYTEKQCAKILADLYDEEGAQGFSFEPIVAFGANGADPHHECDNTKLRVGDSIIIDIGGLYNHYCSDMTRTIYFGCEPNEEQKKVYQIVQKANLKAIKRVKEGMKFSDIDLAAREYISEKGYGQYFTHRTGHSIGIEVHDKGDVSSSNNDNLKEGMIFSIEPGIYLPNKFGVRIEDLVLVTKDGCEVLNSVSKEIKTI